MRNETRWVFWLFLSLVVFLTYCSRRDPKLQIYYAEGERLYVKHCSNCHQTNGKGLGMLYPPVDVSDFIDQHENEVICLIKFGRQGEMIVNGKMYNQPMPGVPLLSELEVAEIVTYLHNSWGREKGIFEVQRIGAVLQKCRE